MIDLKDIGEKRLAETNLTVQELLSFVEQIVTEQLRALQSSNQQDNSDLADWWQSMLDDIIVPEAGTPSAIEMLREERDQWYKPT